MDEQRINPDPEIKQNTTINNSPEDAGSYGPEDSTGSEHGTAVAENPAVCNDEPDGSDGSSTGGSTLRSVLLILLAGAACLAVAFLARAGYIYAQGVSYYQDHFLRGTVIDHTDVSDMAISDLENMVQEYSIRVIERTADGSLTEEIITSEDMGYSYSSLIPLEETLEYQNRWLWFLDNGEEYELNLTMDCQEDLFLDAVDSLVCFDPDFQEAPRDACITDYESGVGYTIIPEVPGNIPDRDAVISVIQEAVAEQAEEVNLDEAGCYIGPEVISTDAELTDLADTLQKYTDVRVTYTFGSSVEVVDGDLIHEWIIVDGTDVLLDTDAIAEYTEYLHETYDTLNKNHKFVTTGGSVITLTRGNYGWSMDTAKTASELAERIENGESGDCTPVYKQTAASYGVYDYGSTYIEINLSAQHLYLYYGGRLILESSIVSGNAAAGNSTPAGIYGITYKQRNAVLKGDDYATPVSYWMPFNGNIGLHDADWRDDFGGDIYLTDGSHGCINLPPSVAEAIYSYAYKGMPVICYY